MVQYSAVVIYNNPGLLFLQIRELHIMCLEGNVWEREEYSSAMQLLR